MKGVGTIAGTEDAVLELERLVLCPKSPGHDHIVWDFASGARVTDTRGREYIDFTSGVLVANIGHANPHVAAAVSAQAGRLLNAYDAPHPLRGQLAKRLLDASGSSMDAVAFLTTGSEALDACMRIARAATGRSSILAFGDAFHGKSLSTSAIGGIPGNRSLSGSILAGVTVAPFPNPYRPPAGLEQAQDLADACVSLAEEIVAVSSADGLAAIVVEPYLGQGGGVVPPAHFFRLLREMADRHGALLVFDEIQAGMGRTGSLFAFQRIGVEPDLLALSKGLGNGVPISAVLGHRVHMAALPAGRLWSTFGGNPLSCAAALATLDILETPGLMEHVLESGDFMARTIRSWNVPGLGDVRQTGLSFGLELVSDEATKEPDSDRARSVLLTAGHEGLIVLPPAGRYENVVRMAPPLTTSMEDIEEGLGRLHKALVATA